MSMCGVVQGLVVLVFASTLEAAVLAQVAAGLVPMSTFAR